MRASVSVVIPTLNEEQYLPHLLQDLILQQDSNFEVILVDAHSDDKTRLLALHAHPFLRLSFFTVKKRNVAYQRNFGAKKAGGDYLIFLDADSHIEPDFIAQVKKRLRKKVHVYIPHISPSNEIIWTKSLFLILNLLIRTSRFIKRPFSSGGNMVVQRNFFITVGGFDTECSQGEDHYFIQTAAKQGGTIRYFKKPLLFVSPRRLEKEKHILFYKYFLSTTYILLKGKMDRDLFEYKMGGDYFDK